MLYEFVGIAQAVAVEDPVFIHHDGVFQAAAEGQALIAQGFHILHEAEGPRPRHFAQVGLVGKIDAGVRTGAIDRRMIENNREIKAETIIG